MPEIARCPICGSNNFVVIKPLIAVCDSYSFRCGAKDLPRISAAMELAYRYVESIMGKLSSIEDALFF